MNYQSSQTKDVQEENKNLKIRKCPVCHYVILNDDQYICPECEFDERS